MDELEQHLQVTLMGSDGDGDRWGQSQGLAQLGGCGPGPVPSPHGEEQV